MGFRRRILDAPRADLTPMIDVVFLLLIFFMISTTFIERPGLDIDLPESSAQQRPQSKREVQVYLSAEGTIYYQQKMIDRSSLLSALASYGSAAEQMTFLLMADKDALHGSVIEMMDLAKQTGFGKLAIATDKSLKLME